MATFSPACLAFNTLVMLHFLQSVSNWNDSRGRYWLRCTNCWNCAASPTECVYVGYEEPRSETLLPNTDQNKKNKQLIKITRNSMEAKSALNCQSHGLRNYFQWTIQLYNPQLSAVPSFLWMNLDVPFISLQLWDQNKNCLVSNALNDLVLNCMKQSDDRYLSHWPTFGSWPTTWETLNLIIQVDVTLGKKQWHSTVQEGKLCTRSDLL